jgi:nitroreductase
MELDVALKTRRSVRIFQSGSPSRDEIEELIEAANWAPSACNVQGWKYIVVDKPEIKQAMVDNGGAIIIKTAPIGILVLYDNRTKNIDYADYIISGGMAIENILLKAHELNLGACCVCHLPSPKYLRKIFGIPNYYDVIAYVLVGIPRIKPGTMARKYSLAEVMAYNKFDITWPRENIKPLKLWFQRWLIRGYYCLPQTVKVKWLNKILDKKFVKKFEN